MAQRGGSATANGILYQILGTLGRAVEVTLRAEVSDEEIQAATLIIEPIGGGGDIQISTSEGRVVEQWKTRSHQRTWSLAELIEEVLPDLFCAVDADVQSYRFVTDGRIGTWNGALKFFQSLGDPPEQGVIADTLDDCDLQEFAQNESVTKRALFLRVAEAVCKRSSQPSASTAHLHRRVWHLLSRLEVQPLLAVDEIVGQLHSYLRAHVERVEDVEAKRHELCGRVLALASSGNARIAPETLLREAGLSPRSFLAWEDLRSKLKDRLSSDLGRIGYCAEWDVRPAPALSQTHVVHVVTGDSGQGKSWTLAALALKVAAGSGLVAWVSWARQGRTPDQIAADVIWQTGLNHDESIPLERVAERRRETNPQSPMPWAFIVVDGVHSRSDADALVRMDWEGWGIRLLMSAPKDVAEYLRSKHQQRVSMVEVGDFTAAQLRRYLDARKRPWNTIPPDVEDLIRQPILASLYCDLGTESSSSPRHEYELMEKYWMRIVMHVHGGVRDGAVVRTLAEDMLATTPKYPWTLSRMNEVGLDANVIQRLVECGWLRERGDGSVQFHHDRLMCWAVAASIATRRIEGDLSVDDVAHLIHSLEDRSDSWAARLGYVPLDTLWLLTAPTVSHSTRLEAWKVIESLEVRGIYSSETKEVYANLLPTLGARVIPAIIERVRQSDKEWYWSFALCAASALRTIGAREPKAVRELIDGLLNETHPALQTLGLHLAVHFPDATFLDQISKLHRPLPLVVDEEQVSKFELSKLSFRAHAACLQCDPTWASRKLAGKGTEAPALFEVAYLLARTQGPVAADVWAKSKARLIDAIPPDKRQSIVNCVLRFRDTEELDRLEGWIRSDNAVIDPSVLLTLALFDPNRAVRLWGDIPAKSWWLWGGSVRDVVIALAPVSACAQWRRVSDARSKEPQYHLTFGSACERVDAETVDVVIERLDHSLTEHLKQPVDHESWHRLSRPAESLDNLCGRIALERLRARRGSEFESRLVDAASRMAEKSSNNTDSVFDALQNILLKIGSDGFTRLVNALLGASSQLSQLLGCKAAPIRPDVQTRKLVASLAYKKELWGGGHNAFPLIQQKAVTALAAMGEGSSFVRAVLHIGSRISVDVSEIRSEQPPLSDEDVGPAAELLGESHHEQHDNAILAIGLSGRSDFRPAIKDLFLRSETENRIALMCMLALDELGGRDSSLDERLLEQYRSGKYKHDAAVLMSTGERNESTRLLKMAIPQSGPLDETDRRILSFLVSQKSQSGVGVPRLDEFKGDRFAMRWGLMHHFASAFNPNDTSDCEELWKEASRPSEVMRIGGLKAGVIRRLAESDPSNAFELAHRSLRSDEHDRSGMPGIMLELDAERAVRVLIEHAIEAYSKGMCRLVGIGLRPFVGSEAVAHKLTGCLSASDSRSRRVAARIAGYLGGLLADYLGQIVLTDSDMDVCLTATSALRQTQRESEASAMIKLVGDARGPEAWVLAMDVVTLVDPGILTCCGDPLKFLASLRTQPFYLRNRVMEALKKRDDRIGQDHRSIVGQWEDD